MNSEQSGSADPARMDAACADAARRDHPRMARERRTVGAMLWLYCRRHHRDQRPCRDALCDECAALYAYALARLAECPFQEAKTTCAGCPVHCYRPEERARIRTVMRWAGPRMLWRHPLLALRHLLDGRRRTPGRRRTTPDRRRRDGG